MSAICLRLDEFKILSSGSGLNFFNNSCLELPQMSKLEGSQQGNVDLQRMEQIEGRIAELTSKLDSNVKFFQGQIGALITAVQQVQQQLRND